MRFRTGRIKIPRKGFSLVELMFGVAILLFVVGALLFVFVSCLAISESSRNLTLAANDAQYVLEQMRALAYSAIAAYAAPSFTNLTAETITLNKTIGVNIADITVNVNWTEKGTSRSFSLSTSIAK